MSKVPAYDDAPTALEALRPIRPCSNADLLRFLTFTQALDKWYSLKKKYEFSGPLSVKENYRKEVLVRESSLMLLERYYTYDEFAADGRPWRPDREFMALFPQPFVMNDGQPLTWATLTNEIIRLLKNNRSIPPTSENSNP